MPDDPFENHPLFKTEEQARVEDTMDGVPSIVDEPTALDWPVAEDTFIGAESSESAGTAEEPSDETLWSLPAISTGATSSDRTAPWAPGMPNVAPGPRVGHSSPSVSRRGRGARRELLPRIP